MAIMKPLPFRITDLHPLSRPKFAALADALAGLHRSKGTTLFLPFEGYRSPGRQNALSKTPNSQSKAWRSAHQYGIAVDFVPFIDGAFVWPEAGDDIWTTLEEVAKANGLAQPYTWDRPHIVDMTVWKAIKDAWL